MSNIFARLAALEQRPQNKIPVFRVRLADGSERIAHGFELVTLNNVETVYYSTAQPCAMGPVCLFVALHPKTEVVADAQH